MRPLRVSFLMLALLAGLSVRPAHAIMPSVLDGVVSGRVIQTLPSGQIVGIPGLQVKLIAPTATRRPVLISITNSRGEYGFARQIKGPYLFEVYRGPVLLYRRVLDTTRDSDFTVSLMRRS